MDKEVKLGSYVKLKDGALNYNGGSLPPHAFNIVWRVCGIASDRCVLGISRDNPMIKLNIPVHREHLLVVD